MLEKIREKKKKYRVSKLNRVVNRIVVGLSLWNDKEIIHLRVEPAKRCFGDLHCFFICVWKKLLTKTGETIRALYPSDFFELKKIAGQNRLSWHITEDGFTIYVITD